MGSGGSSHRLWPAPQCLSVALKFNGRASNCPILYISLVGPLGPLFTPRTNSSICGKAPNCYLSQLSFWFLIHLCLKCILIFPEVHFWNFRSHFSFSNHHWDILLLTEPSKAKTAISTIFMHNLSQFNKILFGKRCNASQDSSLFSSL